MTSPYVFALQSMSNCMVQTTPRPSLTGDEVISSASDPASTETSSTRRSITRELENIDLERECARIYYMYTHAKEGLHAYNDLHHLLIEQLETCLAQLTKYIARVQRPAQPKCVGLCLWVDAKDDFRTKEAEKEEDVFQALLSTLPRKQVVKGARQRLRNVERSESDRTLVQSKMLSPTHRTASVPVSIGAAVGSLPSSSNMPSLNTQTSILSDTSQASTAEPLGKAPLSDRLLAPIHSVEMLSQPEKGNNTAKSPRPMRAMEHRAQELQMHDTHDVAQSPQPAATLKEAMGAFAGSMKTLMDHLHQSEDAHRSVDLAMLPTQIKSSPAGPETGTATGGPSTSSDLPSTPVVPLVCRGCGKRILREFLMAKDAPWHPECLKCATCGTLLAFQEEGYGTLDGEMYCITDYQRKLGRMCARCRLPLLRTHIHTTTGERFHPSCFSCFVCCSTLGSPSNFNNIGLRSPTGEQKFYPGRAGPLLRRARPGAYPLSLPPLRETHHIRWYD